MRACLNVGVDFVEPVSKGRLFLTAEPVKEKDLSLKVFLFVESTQRVKLSGGEQM